MYGPSGLAEVCSPRVQFSCLFIMQIALKTRLKEGNFGQMIVPVKNECRYTHKANKLSNNVWIAFKRICCLPGKP